MTSTNRKDTKRYSLPEAIQAAISEHLYGAFNNSDNLIGNLDRWTHQQITGENLAKVMLVLESDDPSEACYGDLIREIDSEAETGIFLMNENAKPEHLQHLIGEPGVSAELCQELAIIAPVLFPEETARSPNNLDVVWTNIRARHDRAHLDASVSEIIMGFLMDDAMAVNDMASVMRSLAYTYHEDVVRRRCDLPVLLDEMEIRDLRTMMTELQERGGDYEERASEIRRTAETRYRIPLS
jgi:hypothetical protein